MKAIKGAKYKVTEDGNIHKLVYLDNGLLSFYNVTTTPSTPSSGIWSAVKNGTGAVNNKKVVVLYIASGGGYAWQDLGNIDFGTTNPSITLSFSPTTSLDDTGWRCVHFYIETSSGTSIMWAGSISPRGDTSTPKNEAWPSSIQLWPPSPVATTFPTVDLPTTTFFPGSFSYANSASAGNLTAGRTYYFGITANCAGLTSSIHRYNEVAMSLAEDADDLPTTGTGINVLAAATTGTATALDLTFNYLPYEIIDDDTAPITSVISNTLLRAIVFAGTTPTDMLPVGDGVRDGKIQTVGVTNQSSSFDGNSATYVSAGDDTITLSGKFPNAAVLKYVVTAGATVGGLTSGTYYYVRNASYNQLTNQTTFQLSETDDGSIINLSLAGGASTVEFRWNKVTITVKEIPFNSDMWPLSESFDTSTYQRRYVSNIYNSVSGIVQMMEDISPSPTSQAPTGTGISYWSSSKLVSTPNTGYERRHILTNRNQKSFDVTVPYESNDAVTFTIAQVSSSVRNEITAKEYSGRVYCANGYNTPFYTNGYVVKPLVRYNYGSAYTGLPNKIPIAKFVEVYKNRLCLYSDEANAYYQRGYVYVSDVNLFNSFQYPGSTTINYIAGNTSFSYEGRGLAVYSQDLSNVGSETFLVIGSNGNVLVWNGDLDQPARQIAGAANFASRTCAAMTKHGLVFVGWDNVYWMRSSQDIVPVGNAIKSFLYSPDTVDSVASNRERYIDVVYNDDQIKILYQANGPSSTTVYRELWLKILYENGQYAILWSGPHTTAEMATLSTTVLQKCALAPTIGKYNDVRYMSYLTHIFDKEGRTSGSAYSTDQSNSVTGQAYTKKIVIKNLGLQQDHLQKLITQIYLATRQTANETFTLTLTSQDGTASINFNKAKTAASELRQFVQAQVPSRFLARVFQLEVSHSSTNDISVYDLSILFQPARRRLIT